MVRYIDANFLFKKLSERREKIEETYGKDSSYLLGFSDCLKLSETAPAVDCKPIVRGEWIKYERAHYFKCSVCRGIVPYKKGVKKYDNGLPEYICCPHCGADMTGGTQD